MLQAGLSLFALVAIAIVAGCGGSSKRTASAGSAAASTPSTTATATISMPNLEIATGTPLTHAQWIVETNAICAPVDVKLKGVSVKNASEYATVLPQVAAYFSNEASALAKLVPPASMVSDDRQLVDGVQLFSEDLLASGKDFASGNSNTGFQLLNTAMAVRRQPRAIAKNDGLTKCAAVR
jgi:hypothetical protein